MARPQEFDPHAALQTAIKLFWEKGYFDASVDEVVKRSGVAKYGIYGTFGNKRELFMKALTQYALERRHDIQQSLSHPDASLSAILAFFKEVPKRATDPSHPVGCLVCNVGMEMGSSDPEIRDFVKVVFQDFGRVIKRCLERAVQKGELVKSTDLGSLATYLVNELRTALMLARSGHSQREIEQHLAIALKVLG